MKALLTVIIGLVAIIVLGVSSYVSNYNYGNRVEQQIKAEYENNQNIMSNYLLKVQEAGQVPAMMKDDLKEVVEATLSGRYGDEGSKAVFQFIQEQNPSVDASLYTKIQQIIEAGRNDFETAQTRLIDIKRSYSTNLGYAWKGFWLDIAGYPKINLEDYKIILSKDAKERFESGEDKAVKIR